MKKVKKKEIRDIIIRVNKTLIWYKKGGWIDTKRVPDSVDVNLVNSLEEFIEARFNRESWEVPELKEACNLLDGYLFKCKLEEPNEIKKRFKNAVITLVDPSEIENPTEELIDLLDRVKKFIGGTKIIFNSVKIKVRYQIID